MAFLVLFEALSPVERAVFMLREVFGYGYPEVAGATGRSETNCRQIFARARKRIAAGQAPGGTALPPADAARRAEGDELARRFFEAWTRCSACSRPTSPSTGTVAERPGRPGTR
ncbi:sigma factor-like helix-turn-helix DNA-binding protein [Streptomyces sp. NPDC055815]